MHVRTPVVVVAILGLAATLAVAAPASATEHVDRTSAFGGAGQRSTGPATLALPDGFQPEGIAINTLPFAFFGSRANGDIFRVNLVTGEGRVITPGPGTGSLGLKLDQRGRLFVAGGGGGNARVVNAITGTVIASYSFATAPTFVNDVVLTPTAAWFTDSQKAVLYRVAIGRHGALGAASSLPLQGDYVHVPGAFNGNGIARTPDGKALLIVQSVTGRLFRVDPATGVATTVDLGGELLTNGDGLLLEGHTLFAVQNALNQVAVIKLNSAGTSGHIVQRLTDPRFDVPTTVASFGNRLYLPNARFTTPPTPTTTYAANAIPKP